MELSCQFSKMASQVPKTKSVFWHHELKHAITMQRRFRREISRNLSTKMPTYKWYTIFKGTVWICKQKAPVNDQSQANVNERPVIFVQNLKAKGKRFTAKLCLVTKPLSRRPHMVNEITPKFWDQQSAGSDWRYKEQCQVQRLLRPIQRNRIRVFSVFSWGGGEQSTVTGAVYPACRFCKDSHSNRLF
jgi:hypothetical protein